ncbi:PTS cellobiose transporter subunit IIC [Suicoccus acidiformans]|uniref:PTS cellobiose transporter subunit IIC n=1 Tax=Suicoccus acidiformans TaxID=2036206 RepID=A0A347WIW3_9LACT|nr:PTS cellobiose transporter subunit IIC [Suicoccus acidiformans]AXY25020.1 PTS cellobiose transporter subunit IIC [Suicoccus acidiformans]
MEKKILIICEAGISASLFVSKFIEESKRNLDNFIVEYAPIGRVQDKLSQDKYDVIVLTPQVRRHEDVIGSAVKEAEGSSKMVFISEGDFSTMNIANIYGDVKEVLAQ